MCRGVVTFRLPAIRKSILAGVADLTSASARLLHVWALSGARIDAFEICTFDRVLQILACQDGRAEKWMAIVLATSGTRLGALSLHEAWIAFAFAAPRPIEALLPRTEHVTVSGFGAREVERTVVVLSAM